MESIEISAVTPVLKENLKSARANSTGQCFLVSFFGLTAYHSQMVTNWITLNKLIAAPAANTSLIYAASIGEVDFDFQSDKTRPVSPGVKYIQSSTAALKHRLSIISGDIARDLKNDETLFIVLVGHGTDEDGDGALLIGEDSGSLLTKRQAEIMVDIAKGSIVLVNLACHSDLWTSKQWRLVAGAVPDTMHSGCFAPHPIPLPRPCLESMEDQRELESLVAYHLKWLPPSTATETRTTWICDKFLRGELDGYRKAQLLQVLRMRKHQLILARHIAEGFGWFNFDDPYGPAMRNLCLNNNKLTSEAIAAGCMVEVLVKTTFGLKWRRAASWLVETWNAHGRPTINPPEWDVVLANSQQLTATSCA